ncbi:ABC-type transport auxiliary lipoprotein family protein [Hellea sp.]|nr:ABC-type transport auxiliary lipoprotein family protein [Hellea sp.]
MSLLPDPAPAESVYRLSAPREHVVHTASAQVIRVDRPSASNVFETRDIIVSPDGRRLAVAGGARWSEVIPVMVQESLIDVMGQRADLVGLIPSSGARTNMRIHMTIKNFEAHYDNGEDSPPLAVVHYSVTLANSSDRNFVGSLDVEKRIRADASRVTAIVNAIDEANKQAMNDIADWVQLPKNRS